MATRDPGLALLQATAPAAALARRIARRLAANAPPVFAVNVSAERAVFNEETWLPAHGEYVSTGASIRCVSKWGRCLPLGCASSQHAHEFSPLLFRCPAG
jgi:hypothetical protein